MNQSFLDYANQLTIMFLIKPQIHACDNLPEIISGYQERYANLFPALRTVAIRVLLLPMSRAIVERSFSSRNRAMVMSVEWTGRTNDQSVVVFFRGFGMAGLR